ncbi:MAG: ABC1 kinase family protein [Aureliella sp.]
MRLKHIPKYATITGLLWKYGLGDLAASIAVGDRGTTHAPNPDSVAPGPTSTDVADPSQPVDRSKPEELTRDLEKLGTAYIKAGQLLSTRTDVLPPEYAAALARLQDNVAPIDSVIIKQCIEREFGQSPLKLFAEFDECPKACASLGQVHHARLRSGREVAVKVQRPGAGQKALEDLAAIQEIAAIIDKSTDLGRRLRFSSMAKAVEFALEKELDYRREAEGLDRLAQVVDRFDLLTVPRVIQDFTRRQVLVMEYLPGKRLTDLSGSVLIELDRRRLAEQLVECYLQQILVEGFFHADPHPGNLLWTNNHRLALLDGGMTVALPVQMRQEIARFLLLLCDGQGDQAADVAMELGETEKGFDPVAFRREVASITAEHSTNPSSRLGKQVFAYMGAGGLHGLVMPPPMILFGKAISQLEQTLRFIDPNIDIMGTVHRFGERAIRNVATSRFTISQAYRSLADMAELSAEMPGRVNRLTRMLADNEFRMHVDAIDEDRLIAGLQKIANRITAGLVIAAMILAAALLLRPLIGEVGAGTITTLAILFFAIAGIAGCYLVWLALWKDERAK